MEENTISPINHSQVEDADVYTSETVQSFNDTVEVDKPLPNFWVRILAMVIDGFILGAFGQILGLLFFDQFSLLGGWGRMIGFVIVLLYFGLLNSSLGNGQSLGKKITKIKVVDKNGDLISWKRSFLRAAILQLPFFLNGLPISSLITNIPLQIIDGVILFGTGIGIVYFYIFNRKTRQSLHDIICRTYVVRLKTQGKLNLGPISRFHYYVFSLILLVAFAAAAWANVYLGERLNYLFPIVEDLNKMENVSYANINIGQTYFYSSNDKKSSTTSYVNVNVICKGKPVSAEEDAKRAARVILEEYPDVFSQDVIVVNISYGYDIGIANSYRTWTERHRPADWSKIIKN